MKMLPMGDCCSSKLTIYLNYGAHEYIQPNDVFLKFHKSSEFKNMSLRNIIAFSLVVALGVILVIHFAMFWIYGGVFIYEDNRIILAIETLMSITIIGFGFERLISSYRSQSKLISDQISKVAPEKNNTSTGRLLYPQTSDKPQVSSAS